VTVAAFPGVRKALEKLTLNLPVTKYPLPVVKNYVSRPSLESNIHKVYNSSKETDAYTV
jgi:hypothetical protein